TCVGPFQILVVYEKERFTVAIVNVGDGNRTTEGKAEIVLTEVGFFRIDCILIPGIGIEHVVEHVLVHAAVIFVSSPLCDQGDITTGDTAVFRGNTGSDNLELGYRVHRRNLIGQPVPLSGIHHTSIDVVIHGAGPAAIELQSGCRCGCGGGGA